MRGTKSQDWLIWLEEERWLSQPGLSLHRTGSLWPKEKTGISWWLLGGGVVFGVGGVLA